MPDIRSMIPPRRDTGRCPEGRKSGKAAAETTAKRAGRSGLTRIAIKREQARTSNHRVEDRLGGLVEETTIVFRRKRLRVSVVNVSSRGAMIECDLPARVGEPIDIFFTDDHRTRAVVRWLRNGRFGVEFVEEMICWDATQANGPILRFAPLVEDDQRPAPRKVSERAPRQRVARRGSLLACDLFVPVRIRDLSPGGAGIECDRTLRAGREVELDLGEAGIRTAQVRWSRNGQVGLRFTSEFDLSALPPGSSGSA